MLVVAGGEIGAIGIVRSSKNSVHLFQFVGRHLGQRLDYTGLKLDLRVLGQGHGFHGPEDPVLEDGVNCGHTSTSPQFPNLMEIIA